jgi:formylglycine-generating enzyme required for sulfatase activity
MVILPAGEFNMGSTNGDKDEQPVHRVTLAKMFAIGKTEVTQGQWRALMGTTKAQGSSESSLGELMGKLKHILPQHKKDVTEDHFSAIMETSPESYKNCGDDCTAEQRRARRESAERGAAESTSNQVFVDNNPSYFKNCGDECPVEQVSWAEAKNYIQKLISKTGKQYRLPSEAEWEYACRGGANTEYCGSDKVESVAWYGAYANPSGNSGKNTNNVATLSANGFGLFDMSGNVWEWVEDSYHANYIGAPIDGSSWAGDAARHTLRGGSWSSKAQEVRAAERGKSEPSGRGSVGFRVVRVLP